MFDTTDDDRRQPTFDAGTGTYELPYDSADGRDVLVTALRSVADIAGVPTTEMEPLGERVDPDVLVGALGAAEELGYPDEGVRLRIHEHDVTIGGGLIRIRPPSEPGTPAES